MCNYTSNNQIDYVYAQAYCKCILISYLINVYIHLYDKCAANKDIDHFIRMCTQVELKHPILTFYVHLYGKCTAIMFNQMHTLRYVYYQQTMLQRKKLCKCRSALTFSAVCQCTCFPNKYLDFYQIINAYNYLQNNLFHGTC